MVNYKIIFTFLSTTSACKMTVQPRLCFTCSYLTLFADESRFGLVRIEKACSTIKEKCCMKTRLSRGIVENEKFPNKAVKHQTDMLRIFLI